MEPHQSGTLNISPLPPVPVCSNLACRLFDEEVAIPATLVSDTDNAAMAVDVAPFTNSMPKADYWEQLVLKGKELEMVATMRAEALATTRLDTSIALDEWLNGDQSNVPSQASGSTGPIVSTPTTIVIPVTEVDLKPSRYFCTEPPEFGPAGTSNLTQM